MVAEIRILHEAPDLRTAYDVLSYDVALELEERVPKWKGRVAMELQVGELGIAELQVDAGMGLTIGGCSWSGRGEDGAPISTDAKPFQHKNGLLSVRFADPLPAGTTGTLEIQFQGKTKPSRGQRPAVYWMTSTDGSGRVDCSLQYTGAHNVFPCKSSFFHPEDVPNRSALALTVPKQWVAIGPGSKIAEAPAGTDKHTFQFSLDQPTPTWALGFAAGPYQVRRFPWKGKNKEVQVELYRLPEHAEAFDELAHTLPSLLEHHERIFGAYPFAKHRLAVVETLTVSTANATWVGVGTGLLNLSGEEEDDENTGSKAVRILSHELGHAWWGHGLFVGSWRDNWLHESFASYGALLYLGEQSGDQAMDDAFQRIAGDVSFKHRLALCDRASACSATSITNALWYKGPWVLRTLRSQVNNDEQWFAALADFQQEFRSKTVSTEDLSRVLGKHTGESWDRFFEEWFEGSGLPCIVGTVRIARNKLLIDLENRKDRIRTTTLDGQSRNFHLGLELQWKQGSNQHQRRLRLEPGANSWSIECDSEPTNVKLVGLESILGPHEVKIIPLPHSGLSRR